MLKSALRWSILARKPTHSTVPAKVAAAFSTTPFRILCRFRQQSYRSHSSSTRTVTLTQAQTSSGVWRFLLASSAVGLALHAESKSESEADASVLDEKQRKRVNGSSPSIACSPIESLGANYTRPVVGIVALNALVFGMWRVVPAQKMLEHFSFNLGRMLTNGRYYLHTPVTSMFSHESLLHFGFNMYALANIAPPVVRVMGEKDFLWAYFAAGILANVGGTAAALLKYGLSGQVGHITVNSLGASGALFGIVALFANLLPDIKFHIIFLPMFSFDALSGLYGAMAIDTAGLVYSFFRRSILDHGAHLGGALTGIALYHYYLLPNNAIAQQLKVRAETIHRERSL